MSEPEIVEVTDAHILWFYIQPSFIFPAFVVISPSLPF